MAWMEVRLSREIEHTQKEWVMPGMRQPWKWVPVSDVNSNSAITRCSALERKRRFAAQRPSLHGSNECGLPSFLSANDLHL